LLTEEGWSFRHITFSKGVRLPKSGDLMQIPIVRACLNLKMADLVWCCRRLRAICSQIIWCYVFDYVWIDFTWL